MTALYFIRHAQPDFTVHDDETRPLTEKGLRDRTLVTAYLWDKDITAVLASPYKRAYDTVAHFAARRDLPVQPEAGFRERAISNVWIEDWNDFAENQWRDFDYKLPHGESLNETQTRCAAALHRTLEAYAGQHVAIGCHGTAIAMVLHYLNPSYRREDFFRMARKMPWAVKLTFDGDTYIGAEETDLCLRPMTEDDYPRVSALWGATAGLGKTPADDSPEAVARFLERNPGISMVAEIGGAIIGAMLCGHDGRRASIYHMAVAEQYQGLGVGKAMLESAYDALLKENIRKVSVAVFSTNTGGDAFWERQGFILRDDLHFRNRIVPGME